MRLFIGIPLSAETMDELSQLVMRLHTGEDSLRWSAPASWHITLQFLGNTSQDQYACIVSQLMKLHFPPISIALESFGFFERAGIFYIGVKPTEKLVTLQQTITAATAICGFSPENRRYHPHITLARSKGKHGIRAMTRLKTKIPREYRFNSFRAETFLLYESFTDPSGSRYEVRETFAFNNIQAP